MSPAAYRASAARSRASTRYPAILPALDAAQQARCRSDAEAGDDEVRRQVRTVPQHDLLHPRAALDGDYLLPEPKPDALALVQPAKRAPDFGTELAFERLGCGGHHRYLQAPLAEAGCGLHRDEPATDDHGATCSGRRGGNPLGVSGRAQEEHVREVGAGHFERARRPTCRDHRGVIGERPAIGEGEDAGGRIQAGHLARPALDLVSGVERFVLERRLLAALLAGQRVFAKHGAVVGRPVFAADHDHTARKTLLPQHLRGNGARRPSADDDKAAAVGTLNLGYRIHPIRLVIHRDQHLPSHDPHRKRGQRVHGGRLQSGAGGNAEGGLVPGADHDAPMQHALGQRPAGMWAGATDRVAHTVHHGEQDRAFSQLHRAHIAFRQLGYAADAMLQFGHLHPRCDKRWTPTLSTTPMATR